MKLGHVALDGTKVKANASKHKAMSYQRMKEKAAQLAAEVAELLRQAQAADDEEDRRYGKDKRGDELPEELAFRERRLEKIREAMAALEAEAQAAAEQAEAEGGKHPGVPDDKAQRNFTDTESRIISALGGKDFLQAYNCQAVVDSAHQVIVAARATNQTSDKQQAAAMMEETIDNVGAVPREVSADAGYYSAKAVGELYALGVDPFVAPEQTRHDFVTYRWEVAAEEARALLAERRQFLDSADTIATFAAEMGEFLKTLKTGTTLARTEVQEPMLELEVAIVGEHELTLPPASFPWDEFDRQDQLWERTQDLKRVRVERNRALLRRWLRRVFTCGLWRN